MNFYFFTYLFLAVLGLHCCMGFSLVAVHGLLIVLASLICDSSASAHRLNSLWCMGLIALHHVGSSQIRDQTQVSCVDRQILYH